MHMTTFRTAPAPRRQTALCLGLLALCLLAGQAARADENDTWALLKKPGHIALLRHAHSPESPPDDGKVDFKNCNTQRKLDDAGRAQAVRLGDALRKHGIKAARIYSSRYCRAMETGKLIKLGPVQPLAALDQVYLADLGGMREAKEQARKFMKTIPPRQLTILVSHVTNISSVAGVSLGSGEMAVVHMEPSGDVTVDGRIKVE
jgi:phosphohistidine phosphatase SixA